MLFAEGTVPAAVILTQIQMENGIRMKNQELSTEEFLSATLLLLWRMTSISCAKPSQEPPSTPPSLSMTKLVFPEPPLAVSLPVSLRSSRSMLHSRVSLRLFQVLTLIS